MIWWITAALAQQQPAVPEMDAQLLRPSFDSRSSLWAETAGTEAPDGLGARAMFGYLREPLVFLREDGEKVALVEDALQVQLVAAYRYDRFRIGVDVPVYLLATSDVAGSGGGTGDLSLDGRVTLLRPHESPIGLAIAGRAIFPTASVQVPLGRAGVGGEIAAIATRTMDSFELNLNVGQRFLPSTSVVDAPLDDELFFVLGGGYALTESAGLSSDLGGTLNYAAMGSEAATLPVELLVGGWGRISEDLVIRGGVGRGVTPGIGSTTARAVVGISYEPRIIRDADGDGLVDKVDGCPSEPEDFDEFQDDDGCPDPDNDGDGVLDADDECPLEPEDPDGFDDHDGCPDISRQLLVRVLDENGVDMPQASVSIVGRATEVSGSTGLLADLHDGEYTISAQAEDYLDASVAIAVPLAKRLKDEVIVRLAPEARVGTLEVKVLDPDGNPIPEAGWTLDEQPGPAFQDGIASLQAAAGERLLVVRAPGYGPARLPITVRKDQTTHTVVVLQPAKVKVTREQIDINETIYFETAKAIIKPESFGLLTEVAQMLLDHPEIELVRIEGHTDSRGSDTSNQVLSEKRAASVLEFLVKQGVEPERLRSIGYGESKPIDDREVPEAWEKNRRVDFFIEKRAEE